MLQRVGVALCQRSIGSLRFAVPVENTFCSTQAVVDVIQYGSFASLEGMLDLLHKEKGKMNTF